MVHRVANFKTSNANKSNAMETVGVLGVGLGRSKGPQPAGRELSSSVSRTGVRIRIGGTRAGLVFSGWCRCVAREGHRVIRCG